MPQDLSSRRGYLDSLPNEFLEQILLDSIYYKTYFGATETQRKISLLSATCRQFRQLLLPKIYQKVHLTSGPRISSFLEVAPAYGKFCQEVTLQIPRTGPITELCSANLRYMVGLKKLALDIWEERPLRELASSDLAFRVDMNAMELHSLSSVFQFLPTSITSLRISGISWSDLAKAISTTQFPSIHTLDLWLHYGSPFPIETANVFNTVFPSLIDFKVEDHWALTVPWVAKAFSGRHLERLAFVEYRSRWPVYSELPMSQFDDWITSISGLIIFNSFTLTSLTSSWHLDVSDIVLTYKA